MPEENRKETVEVSEVDMNLEIIMRDVDAIIPYDKNPRDNDNSVDNVIESIKNFGFLVPIVIDKDNVLVAGHTRIKALKKMGIKTVFEAQDYENFDDLVDQDSFVDYMLIDQIMGEKDHYNKSFKFYRRLGEKIKFGPIWDYDWAMHTPWTNLPNDDPGINQSYYSNIFTKKYFGVTENKQALADRWYDIGKDSILELQEHLLEYAETLKSELYKDADLWYSGDYALVDRNIVYITDYIYNQIDVLDEHYNKYR